MPRIATPRPPTHARQKTPPTQKVHARNFLAYPAVFASCASSASPAGIRKNRLPSEKSHRDVTVDGNGNVRALVKADATSPAASAITARYAYDGFGKEVAVSGVDAEKNSFRFSTKQLDVETGMNYYGYRFYAADAGRWINRDPIGEEGGFNIYEMTGNDSIDFFDYAGLKKKPKKRPKLSAKQVSSPTLGTCGDFSWSIAWSVDTASDKTNGGQVIQDIEYRTDIKDCKGNVKEQKTVSYSELWRVLPGTTTIDGFSHMGLSSIDPGANQDTFAGGSYPCSKGRVTVVGFARYYSNQANPNPAWGTGNGGNGTYSGDLPSDPSNPGWDINGSTSTLVKHAITIKWDCCKGTRDTELTYKTIQ